MITFSKLGSYGRLGNQLFQIASVIGIAKEVGTDYKLPIWSYAKWFKIGRKYPNLKGEKAYTSIKEQQFHFDPEFCAQNALILKNYVVDILGYLQSEKWFKNALNAIRENLMFDEGELFTFLNNSEYFPMEGDVAVHIRRGDFSENKNYAHLMPEYYGSLFADNPNKIYHIFTDDYEYARFHFRHYPNVLFCDNYTDIEHLMLMSQFTELVIANSSFSWWAAWLAEQYNEKVKVIRPTCLFDGELLQNNDSKDFYPERWNTYRHNANIDLRDTTFIIPVSHDSKDRRKNLDLIVCMLQRNFETNIIIGEQGTDRFKYFDQWCKYVKFDYPVFHRTKMLNEMTKMAETPYVVNYDADVLMVPGQIWKAIDMLRKGEADFAYPYDSRFARVPRIPWFDKIQKSLDLYVLKDEVFKGMGTGAWISVGGCVAYNKQKFIESGMENENFISHAPEDAERFFRYKTLGYKVKRTDGALYHIDHFMGHNSVHEHEFFGQNKAEWRKIKHMTSDELREYVKTWEWCNSKPLKDDNVQ